MPLQKIKRGGHFCVLTGMWVFQTITLHRATKIDDIRISRWPWDECALSHECEANAGKLALKITTNVWKVMAGLAERKKI